MAPKAAVAPSLKPDFPERREEQPPALRVIENALPHTELLEFGADGAIYYAGEIQYNQRLGGRPYVEFEENIVALFPPHLEWPSQADIQLFGGGRCELKLTNGSSCPYEVVGFKYGPKKAVTSVQDACDDLLDEED